MTCSRESMIRSAFRSFLKMFFAICGIFFAIFLCSLLYSLTSGTTLSESKTTMSILPDANGNRQSLSMASPVILQLNIHGVIGDPTVLDSDVVQNILIESRSGLLAHDRVKGILIHFNTPGGTVLDSDNIYRMLKEYKAQYKVPVYAYVDGLCASGGMYIASAADKIYAGPTAIVGSVGVIFGPFFNVFDTLGKLGIQTKTLTQGLDKDALNPLRPWKEGEDASYKAIISYFYDQFVHVVTSARPKLDKDKLIHEYGAQIFDPIRAENYGYIDHANSSRNATLLALLQEANIDPEKAYQVVELEPKHEWIADLLQGKLQFLNGKMEHSLDLGQPKIRDHFAYLYKPD